MIKLHTDYFVTIGQIHTNHAHRRSSCRTYIRLFKANTHTKLCNQEYFRFHRSRLYFNQFVIFTKIDSSKSIFPYIAEFHHRSLLNNASFCNHEKILILFICFNRNHSRYLFTRIKLQDIYNRNSSGSTA